LVLSGHIPGSILQSHIWLFFPVTAISPDKQRRKAEKINREPEDWLPALCSVVGDYSFVRAGTGEPSPWFLTDSAPLRKL
jgi:hypothetical protein